MEKPTINDIRALPETFRIGFLAARAMPDGALAVAIKFGSLIQIMRLYMRSIEQTVEWGHNRLDVFSPHFRNVRHSLHNAQMDFAVTDCIIVSADAWDEHAYHQQIPQYKEIPPMETRLLE